MLTGEIHGRAKGDDDKSNEGRRHGEFQKTTLDHYEKEKQQNKEKRSTPPKKMIKESKTKDID